jgi:hypothetical protein
MTLPCGNKPAEFSDKPGLIASLQACSQRHKLKILFLSILNN